MKHIWRACPHCTKRIKITEYSWGRLEDFYCPICGTHLKKTREKYGGIIRSKLECV